MSSRQRWCVFLLIVWVFHWFFIRSESWSFCSKFNSECSFLTSFDFSPSCFKSWESKYRSLIQGWTMGFYGTGTESRKMERVPSNPGWIHWISFPTIREIESEQIPINSNHLRRHTTSHRRTKIKYLYISSGAYLGIFTSFWGLTDTQTGY